MSSIQKSSFKALVKHLDKDYKHTFWEFGRGKKIRILTVVIIVIIFHKIFVNNY